MRGFNIYYHVFKDKQEYGAILELQEKQRLKVLNSEIEDGIILFLEHEPVYTLGIRGQQKNILFSDEKMKELGISKFKIRRGGDITYHGPGQLVVYPIVNIRKLSFKSIKQFVSSWGEGIAAIFRDKYQIKEAEWRSEKTGIWVGNSKLMAVGFHFSKFVSAHGVAINIDPDFFHFSGIIPCGIVDGGVTSLSKLLERPPSKEELIGDIIDFVKIKFPVKEVKELKTI